MKIGVIFALYNCEEYLDDCLAPWIKLRKSHNLILSATSGRFKPYADLGIPDKNQETINKIAKKGLDFVASTSGDNLLDEDSSRNVCMNYLKPHNCDLIWLVDGDEIYTEGQIKGIIDFTERNPNYEGFSIYLKNYAISYPYFIPPWSRPTLYRNRAYGGINRFYFDSFFEFNDGIHGVKDIELLQIPKRISFVDHHSWTDREATRDKIRYQNVRYSTYFRDGIFHEVPEGLRCQYEIINNGIYFNRAFHQGRSMEIPSLHEYPTDTILAHLIIEYDRSENKIKIRSDYTSGGYTLVIKSLDGDRIYNSFDLSVGDNYQVWFIPSISEDELNSDIFEGYRIEIFLDKHIVHIENILTKIGIA